MKKIDYLTRKHIVLGQCFSGGFVSPLLSACYNISVATASANNEYSFATNDGKYEEFLYHWVSAAAGKTPDDVSVNADINGYEGGTQRKCSYGRKRKMSKLRAPSILQNQNRSEKDMACLACSLVIRNFLAHVIFRLIL